MSEPQIRDALRQLGSAVGALVRAVVRAVRRRRAVAAAPEPAGGPPQEWLDLVAETDPEWLARSRWADRVVTKEPVREGRPRRWMARADSGAHRAAGDIPAVPPEPDDTPSATPWTAPSAAVTRPRASEEVTGERAARRSSAAEPRARRLLPTEPQRHHDLGAPDTTSGRHARLERPVDDVGSTDEAVDGDASEQAPYPATDLRRTLASPHLEGEPPAAPHRHPGAPRATVTEFPGTWVSAPGTPLRQAPSVPSAATPSVWPELPPTPSLDETLPARGLAAALWELDGRPDTLTTAQRRS